MPLRAFDPAIARWNRIDPVTHYAMSTYNAFDNNPVFYADPSGGDSWGVSGGNHYGIYGSTGSAIYWGAGDSFQNNGLNASDFTSFGSDVGSGLAAAGFFPDNNFIPSNSNGDSNKSFFYVDLNHDITEQEAEAFLNQSSEGDCCQWFTDILDKTWGNISRGGWQSSDSKLNYWLGDDGFTYAVTDSDRFFKVGFSAWEEVDQLPPMGEEPIQVGFSAGSIKNGIVALKNVGGVKSTLVYFAREGKKVIYVGITNNFAVRAAVHYRKKGINIEEIPGLSDLSRYDARAIEQVLIESFGLGKNGGSLINRINSISQKNPIYGDALKRGAELLKTVGFKY